MSVVAQIFVIFSYCLSCYLVVRHVVKKTKRYNSSRLYRGITAFFIFNIPLGLFVIPGVFALPYYCENEAGIWLYKTPGQWREENPSIAETLSWKQNSARKVVKPEGGGIIKTYYLNERFDWIVSERPVFLTLTRHVNTIVDRQSKEVLAKKVEFSRMGIVPMWGKGDCYLQTGKARWTIAGRTFIEYKFMFEVMGE